MPIDENNGGSTGTTSDSQVTVDHGNVEPQSNAATNGTNHDRLQQAYAKATGGVLTNDTPTIDSLSTMDLPSGDHKGIDYNKVMNDLPDDAKRILANLRSDYTKKTQALATQTREVEEQRQTLLTSKAYNDMLAKAAEEPAPADPWDAHSFEKRIEQEVAKRLTEVLKPMQTELETNARKAKLQEFKAANPDLETYKREIVEVLKNNASLTLEQAYYIIKGKNQTETLRKNEQELSVYKNAAKEYGMKVSIGSNHGGDMKPPPSVKRDAYSIYKWLEANKRA